MLGTQALFIFILLCFLGSFLASAQNVASITALLPCTDPALEYQGYTYSYQEGGYKAWSHCKIFHPDTEPELCGVSKVWSDVYICDPDRLLFSTVTNSSFGDEMGDVLQSTVDTLLRDCPEKNTGTSDANSESVVIAVLLLEALKTSDSSSSGLCMNSCGEIMPTYENSSQATAEDHDTAAYNFAQQLISNEWVIGQCDNQVLLLYVEQQNKLHIYSGDGATKRFGDSMLQETFEEIKGIVENKSNQTELGEAMLEGVVLLASTMRPGAVMDFSSPAVIMLAAFLACLVLLIVGISIFIFGNSKDDPE